MMKFAVRIPQDKTASAGRGPVRRPLLATVALVTITILSSNGQLNLNRLIPLARAGLLDLPALPGVLDAGGGQRDSSPGTLDIIKARGFISEFYLTKSRDGRTPLAVYHIINPLANQWTLNRYPVLVLHGVYTDSSSMVVNSERQQARRPIPGRVYVDPQNDTSLALTLASNNFDVWLADARGTNMNNHLASQELDPIERQSYWNFTLDDQIANDLPAIIDFVLAQTHSKKLHYIGYSESTYFMFGLLSRSPHYQSKLISFVALAPVAFVNNIKGSFLSIFSLSELIPEQINGNFAPQFLSDTVGLSIRKFCNNPILFGAICRPLDAGGVGIGDDGQTRQLSLTLMKGVSIKSVRQFIQNKHRGRFGMYDYGPMMNLRQYGQTVPPDYPLENIRMPGIILFRGTNDFLSDPPDQAILLARLGTRPYRDFNLPGYNHLDVLAGSNVIKDVNEPAVRLMFELAQANAQQEGAPSVLKDPQQANLPAPFKPLVVLQPDGSRGVKFSSQLVNNLVGGIFEANTRQRAPFGQIPFFGGI